MNNGWTTENIYIKKKQQQQQHKQTDTNEQTNKQTNKQRDKRNINDSERVLRYILKSYDLKRPQFSKDSSFDMIIIHIGILIYPVKDSTEKTLLVSK